MTAPKIQKNKIRDIIKKISELVELYAKVHNLTKYIMTYFDDVIVIPASFDSPYPYKNLVLISRIDFKEFLNKSNAAEVKQFVEKVQGLVSDTELEMLFIKKYYPDYLIILNTLNMIMYNTPREISKEDLEELNKLYKKYSKNDNPTTTDNKNT